MKANEASDKIYRHQTTGNLRLDSMYYECKPAKIRYDDKIIEYTRTDAFIEKACKWLDSNLTQVSSVKKSIIEEFKKAMI